MSDLWKLSARDMVALLRRGAISPLDAVDTAIARIEETDSALNAMPIRCFGRARDRAGALTRITSRQPTHPFLYGLPIAVKDNTDVAGLVTTHGSRALSDNVATTSEIAVERLEAAGAIILGKTNLPEFSAGGTTFNDLFDVTANPWNTAVTPGGSSGGSASALAAGQVWLATGNDLGGSIRGPAAFCGIAGLRPSPGRVPRGNSKQPFSLFSVEGPMARNVRDLAMMLEIEAGPHPKDPLSMGRAAAPYVLAAEQPSLPARIAYSPDLGLTPVHDQVRSVCGAAMRALESFGAAVEEAHPDLRDSGEIFQVLRGVIYVGRVGPLLESKPDLLKPEVIWNAEKGLALSVKQISHAEIAWGSLYRRVMDFFSQYDLLICPAVIIPAFDKQERYLAALGDAKFTSYIDWLQITWALTLTTCPILSIPCGFTESGLPVGLQIVARPYEEYRLLSVGAFLEEIFGIAEKLPIDPRTPTTVSGCVGG